MIAGIDLGTTFSAVATIDPDGRPATLRNSIGELTTPSVVYFESATSVLVGVAARHAAVTDPDNGVELIKRQMGTDTRLLFHGVTHTPESVSSLILRSLVTDTLPRDEPVRAVITVPAYFGIREREATLQAAKLAGIEVLELLAEPVAAALHYGTTSGSHDRTTLVYDLGGGTFDTTVLHLGADGLRVVATDGDSQLGGADWDERITTYLLENFVRAVESTDPYEDEQFLRHVDEAAEKAKRALSTTTARDVVLRKGSASTTVPFNRTVLAELGADLVDRTTMIVRRVLSSATRLGVRDVDDVILVGGVSRMPAVSAALTALGMTPRLVDPDLAVVLGAAIRAHQLASRTSLTNAGGLLSAIADKPTTSVVPRSFGILLADSHDPAGTRELVVHTVHQNQPLPASATASFCTIVEGQDRVRIQVYEQAGDLPSEEVTNNRRVLDGELTDLPPLPAGSRIDVTLSVSKDGLLALTAQEPRQRHHPDPGGLCGRCGGRGRGPRTGRRATRPDGEAVMGSWVRRQFGGIGLTQSPPGPHLSALQAKHGGTVLLCIDVSGSMSGEPLRQAIRGGTKFLQEAEKAHYRCGLVLWSDTVDQYVPPSEPLRKVQSTLQKATIYGGTELSPALHLAIKDLAPLTGDRVLCIFSDGYIGDPEYAQTLAHQLCAMGVRIIVRGLGHDVADSLANLACPDDEDDQRVVENVTQIDSGIASMARGLSARRRRG